MDESKIKYGCLPTPNYIGTNPRGGIEPINGKIYWHVDESSLTQDMEKYKIIFAIEQSFKKWQQYFHNIEFVPSNNPSESAIVIKFKRNGDQGLPTPFGGGVLAYAFYPFGKSLGIHADIFLNDEYEWAEMHKPGHISLQKVFIHEVGHSLGLAHSTDIENIMYPQYQPNNDIVITQDTIEGIHKLYGKPPKEEDDEAGLVNKFIRKLVGFRGEKFLQDINEPEVVFIAHVLGIDATEENLKQETITKILEKIK